MGWIALQPPSDAMRRKTALSMLSFGRHVEEIERVVRQRLDSTRVNPAS